MPLNCCVFYFRLFLFCLIVLLCFYIFFYCYIEMIHFDIEKREVVNEQKQASGNNVGVILVTNEN
jgi:hypothetical protein